MRHIPNHITAIIFDLGGVILNLDPQRSVQAFASLSGLEADRIYQLFAAAAWVKAFEKGEITPADFRQSVRQALQVPLRDEEIDRAWNAMLLDLPPARLQMLAGLRPRYRTFVLSNTNAIHLEAFGHTVNQATGGGQLEDYFDAVYYSHRIGMRKPDREIFDFVLAEQGLEPQHTLFIDDMEPNLAGAREAGLRVWHLASPDQLQRILV